MGNRVSGLVDIVTEMADQIRAVLVAVDEMDVQVEHRMVLTPSPLTIDMYPGDLSRSEDSAGFDDISGAYIFTVRARINTPDFDAAYDILLELMDDEDDLCIAQALYSDTTLNGHATSIDVREFSGMRAFEHPNGVDAFLGCQWTVFVIPAKS